MAKVMISVPDELLAEVDGAAGEQGLSRSALVRRALERELRDRDARRRSQAIASLREQFAHMPPFDAVVAVRQERER